MASPRLYGEVGVVDDQRVLDEYVYRVLKVGTSGLLLKHASRDQVTGGVRAVAVGETVLAAAITRRLIEDFCSDPVPGTPAGRLDQPGGLPGEEMPWG